MNEKQMLHDLDERARAATTDLTTRAAARPVPTFDPDRATTVDALAPSGQRAPSRRPMLAVAAAVVVALLLAGTWFMTNDGGDTDVAEEVVATSIRPYLPEDIPDGLNLAGVADSGASETASDGAVAIGPFTTYGPAIEDPRIAVFATPQGSAEDRESLTNPPREIEVGDRTGYVHEESGLPGLWLEVPANGAGDGTHVNVFSRHDDLELLTTIAAGATVDGLDVAVAEGSLPEGWRQLDSDPDGAMLAGPMGAPRGASQVAGHSAFYMGDETGRIMGVQSLARPAASVHTQRLFLESVETVTVRGHDAILGRLALGMTDGDDSWVVRWMERPGELVSVSGTGVARDEVLAAAESLQPVGAARWEELLEATALGDFQRSFPDEAPRVELARGRFADGTAWVLRYSPEQSDGPNGTVTADIELNVALTGNSSSSSSGSSFSAIGTEIDAEGNPVERREEVFQATSTLEQSGRAFSAGLVRNDVARVEIRAADGTVTGEAQMVSAEGVTAWVAELADDGVTAVAFSADGAELGSYSVERYDDGSVTMSPQEGTGPAATTTIVGAPPSTEGSSTDGGSEVAPTSPTTGG